MLLVLHPYLILAPSAKPESASDIVIVALWLVDHVVLLFGLIDIVGAVESKVTAFPSEIFPALSFTFIVAEFVLKAYVYVLLVVHVEPLS